MRYGNNRASANSSCCGSDREHLTMKAHGLTILSSLCIIGAVTLAALGNPETQFVALVGLAGTLAGRGSKEAS